jgi:hypothetical protein
MTATQPKRKVIGVAHFTVDFDGLTRIVRDFWAEHEFDRAIQIMTRSGIPVETAHDVIRGKKRMAQDPEGKPGVDGTILVDDWKPNLGVCMFGQYPDPDDLPKIAKRGMKAQDDLLTTRIRDAQQVASDIKDALSNFDTIEAARLLDIFEAIPADATKHVEMNLNRSWIRECAQNSLRDRARKEAGIKSPVEAFVAHQLEMDKRPKPKPTRDFSSDNGWVLPGGAFYALKGPMEHIWAAGAIGGLTEKEAEEKGWIKVSLSALGGFYIINHTRPTQKQIDTLFDWAQADPLKSKRARGDRESLFKRWLQRLDE